jgi:pectin methylesterase-like acyl-CoA thioesterase
LRKEAIWGITLALLLTGLLTMAFYVRPAKARTIVVPDDFRTIQGAVDAANDGDIVHVRAGTYVEDVLIDNKSIALIGDGAANTFIESWYCGV